MPKNAINNVVLPPFPTRGLRGKSSEYCYYYFIYCLYTTVVGEATRLKKKEYHSYSCEGFGLMKTVHLILRNVY